MSVVAVAESHYRRQVALARRVAEESAAAWRTLDPLRLDASWAAESDRLLALVTGGQALAAADADGYVTAALSAQHLDPAAAGAVNARSLAGVASDGRGLATLLYEPVIAVKTALRPAGGRGATVEKAMTLGMLRLDTIVRTQLADAARVAVGVGVVARRSAGGWVRMLSTPSCARCIVLAGKFYRWSSGFLRHPRCDCRHIPAAENTAGDLRTDPGKYFRSLPEPEQNKLLGRSGAQAVRDGADLAAVVNARRGMTTTAAFGRTFATTREGTTRRGLFAGYTTDDQGRLQRRTGPPPRWRLMPEQIYTDATDRDDAIRLLRHHGYLR
ncbi:hypothetical protein Lfu02_79930 [Longispora fulva]|uniref:Uncharacterized protein n=1 Tax=Longispora fulva TaxID=619741 RepID=A0A8J7KN15_9ACTN|nr:hypothetical protein [Longispora fulva]MBG6141124.1 hypothetical protein [Longispora fulva]GIG63621.1 hypothetical protein Lfu02_79930 [Longispora fulva]